MTALLLGLALAQTTSHGEWRMIESMPQPFVIDPDGRTPGWGPSLDHRFRFGLDAVETVREGRTQLRLGFEADVLTGQVAGATWGLSDLDERRRHVLGLAEPGSVALRRLEGGIRTGAGDLQVGATMSHWGLGLVANDGAHDPWFGRVDFGDRVARVRFATAPLGADVPLFVIVAGDRVLADEFARTSQGDDAYQGLLSVLWRTEAGEAGLYSARRVQTDADGYGLQVWVLDATASVRREVQGGDLRLAFEAATLLGSTDVLRTAQSAEGVAVRNGGAVGMVEWLGERHGLLGKVAWASGDRTPDDDVYTAFRFDRDHNVGMVLFDEVQGATELAAIEQGQDPDRGAVSQPGLPNLATEGAFQSAFALQPAGVWAPLNFLELRAGAVFAWATGPISQPVQAALNGGAPTNPIGEPSDGRYLGTELDWAIGTRVPEDWSFRPQLQVQGGHGWTSEAWLGGQRVDLLLVTGRLRW